ncbi:MAG: YceI family protein [Deltaproteobacteria bacterium]|nr:YceI family protein [Deltaproteobacteria bacterium]
MDADDKHKFAGLIITLIMGLSGFALLPATGSAAASENEQLIVFLQPDVSAVDAAFRENHLPQIRKIAHDMDVSVHEVNAGKGSPGQVTITPLIVYQNHRGRSIYQGRTTTPARLRNFIRTSRFVPQGKESNRREDIPILQQGRSRIWAPLKVAAVTGTRPENYDNDAFIAEALENIARGFKKFQIQKEANLGRGDRGFYMDFNPWRSEGGTLYLTVVLFSQFDCKEPVFTKKITASWEQRNQLFQQASATMEQAAVRISANPQNGDSFDPLSGDVPKKNWETIGFPLPPAPEKTIPGPGISVNIPQNWILAESGPDDPPMIQFRFPAPLDNYSGEVTSATVEFTLADNLIVDGSAGSIEIDTTTAITMGQATLDEAIRGSMLLYARKFPTAGFVLNNIGSDQQPIAYGKLTPAFATGTFTLKGKSAPLGIKLELEPIIAEDGKPRLLIRGGFKIDLLFFNIEGADGPAPANHTVLLDLNFILKGKG